MSRQIEVNRVITYKIGMRVVGFFSTIGLFLHFRVLNVVNHVAIAPFDDNPLSNIEKKYIPGSSISTPSSDPPPFTFAACLLVRDANVLLPEWLAYHYIFLPLRRLIIGVDPLSLTSPDWILGVFNSTFSPDLKMTIWKDDEFIKDAAKRDWMLNLARNAHNVSSEELHKAYLIRQMAFNHRCLADLHQEAKESKEATNQTKPVWTLLLDVDEYLAFNHYEGGQDGPPRYCDPYGLQTFEESECWQKYQEEVFAGRHPRGRLREFQDQTAANFIDSGIDPMFTIKGSPCVSFTRTQMSGMHDYFTEKNSDEKRLDPLDNSYPIETRSLVTFRFRRHGPRQTNLQGKSMVDATRYFNTKPYDIINPHRPLSYNCLGTLQGQRRKGPARFIHANVTFRVNHYVGSPVEFNETRAYKVNGEDQIQERNHKITLNNHTDNTMQAWFDKFVNEVKDKKTALWMTRGLIEKAKEEIKHVSTRNNV